MSDYEKDYGSSDSVEDSDSVKSNKNSENDDNKSKTIGRNEELHKMDEIKEKQNGREDEDLSIELKEESSRNRKQKNENGNITNENYNFIPKSLKINVINSLKIKKSFEENFIKEKINEKVSDTLPNIHSRPKIELNLKNNKYYRSKLVTLNNAKKIKLKSNKSHSISKLDYNSEEDKETKYLQKINSELRLKLRNLNEELNIILDKIINENSHKTEKKLQLKTNNDELIIEKEIENSKKILNSLINEYNNNFKKNVKMSNVEYITEIKNESENLDKEIINFTQLNKDLETKIKQLEHQIKAYTKKNEDCNQMTKDFEDLDYKIELHNEKIVKIKLENERLTKIYEKNEENYNSSIEKYNKLIEISENYDINLDHDKEKSQREKEQIKKYESLIKKLNITEHAREAMTKNYITQINNNEKHISELEDKIEDLKLILNDT